MTPSCATASYTDVPTSETLSESFRSVGEGSPRATRRISIAFRTSPSAPSTDTRTDPVLVHEVEPASRSPKALSQMWNLVEVFGDGRGPVVTIPVSNRQCARHLGITVGTFRALLDRLGPVVVSRVPLAVDLDRLQRSSTHVAPGPGRNVSPGNGPHHRFTLQASVPGGSSDSFAVAAIVGESKDQPSSPSQVAEALVRLVAQFPELSEPAATLIGRLTQALVSSPGPGRLLRADTPSTPTPARADRPARPARSERARRARPVRLSRASSEQEKKQKEAFFFSLPETTDRTARPETDRTARLRPSRPRVESTARPRDLPRDPSPDVELDRARPTDRSSPLVTSAEVMTALQALRGGFGRLDDRGLAVLRRFAPEALAMAVDRVNRNSSVRDPIGFLVSAALRDDRLLFALDLPGACSNLTADVSVGGATAGHSAASAVDGSEAMSDMADDVLLAELAVDVAALERLRALDPDERVDLEQRWRKTLAGRLSAQDSVCDPDEQEIRLSVFLRQQDRTAAVLNPAADSTKFSA